MDKTKDDKWARPMRTDVQEMSSTKLIRENENICRWPHYN